MTVVNLKKYILGMPTGGTNLDLNGDGSIDTLDLIIAKQNLFNE
jgi:hypothetical protein